MMIQARLERKPGAYPPPRCQVDKVVELSAEEFDDFLRNPLRDKMFISRNKEVMYHDGNMVHCLLVLGRDRNDGVLVESEGYDYAKYASFLFGARDIVNAQIQQAAERIVRKGVENTSEGSWYFYFYGLYQQMGLVVTEDNGLGDMLLDALWQRPEISEAEMDGESFGVVFYLDFCEGLSSPALSRTAEEKGIPLSRQAELFQNAVSSVADLYEGDELYGMLHDSFGMTDEEIQALGFDFGHHAAAQPEERPVRSQEQLVNKLLDYLAEHDGSDELYQMLHTDLGFTNAEIDALGFDLAHRFEDEPGLNQPQM